MPGFSVIPRGTCALVLGSALVPLLLGAAAARPETSPTALDVRLSEWKVEVSGKGLEQRSGPIAAGAEGTLNVTLKPGRYQLYCPVGNGAHKQAGMKATITVTADESAPSSTY
jgi:hypothetical protein